MNCGHSNCGFSYNRAQLSHGCIKTRVLCLIVRVVCCTLHNVMVCDCFDCLLGCNCDGSGHVFILMYSYIFR